MATTNVDNVNHTYTDTSTGKNYALDTKTGLYQVASTLATPTPTSVPSSSIKPTTAIATTPVPTSPYSGFVADQKSVLDTANTEATTAKSDYSSLLSSITGLQDTQANRGADQIAAENAQGIPEMAKNIKDLEAKARESKLSYDLASQTTPYSLEAQGRGISTSLLRGQEAVIQRRTQQKAAIDNLVQNSNLQAAQGNAQYAQSLADRATALKYDPIEQKLKNSISMLTNYRDLLTSADKKAADAKTSLLNLQVKELEAKKEDEKSINSIRMEIAKNGGDTSVLDNATSVSDALNKATPYLKTPNTEVIKMKMGDNEVAYLVDKTTGKVIKSFGASSGGYGSGEALPVKNSPFSGVVDTILASGKFTKDQSVQIRNAINNGEDPVTVIKNNAKNIMGQTEATSLTKYEAAKSAMQDLKSELNAFYAAGGNTSYISGNYEKVINKLGTVNDPKLVDLATQIQAQLQVYRNAVSGTAYSVQEGQDIASIFPGVNKSKQLNDSIFAGRDKAFDSSIDGIYRTALGDKTYAKIKEAQSKSETTSAKGSLTDTQFVDQVFKANKINYNDPAQLNNILSQLKPGEIPVIDNRTGGIMGLPYNEFNTKLYTKI